MMRNFGINTLGLAQSVIGKQEYQIREFLGRTRNAAGYEINEYSDPVTRHASVQPLSSRQKQERGLKINSFYIDIYDQDLIQLLTRSTNPPQIIWNGYIYTPEPSAMDWSIQGGWNQVTAIRGEQYAND